jgi:hypothetical protein
VFKRRFKADVASVSLYATSVSRGCCKRVFQADVVGVLSVCFKCFRCFKWLLQVFHLDVAKVRY